MKRLFGALVALIIMIPLIAIAQPIPLPAQSDPTAVANVSAAARHALMGVLTLRSDESDRIRAGDITIREGWAFGLLTVRAPDGLHAEPDIRLFLAYQDGEDWRVLLENTREFDVALSRVPTGVMPEAARSMLTAGLNAPRAAADLGLPYAVGETWTLTGGPHPNGAGTESRPWSAIDLAFPGSGVGKVRATDGGIAWVPSDCPNLIRIDHPGGWRTGYYHVVNIRVSNAQVVQRGQWIADEGMATGCGGFASGPHLHLSLRQYDPNSYGYPDTQTFVNIGGNVFGGWRVQDGNSTYQGCMRRLRDGFTACAGNGQIIYENQGGVTPTLIPNPTPGASTPVPVVVADQRLDYNRDGYPDLWAVDLRPDDGADTKIWVYNGRNPSQLMHAKQTTLPQQPVALNTAFAVGDYNGDNMPDVWLFHRRMDDSLTTALRILDIRGEVVYDLLEDTPTALPQLTDDVRFAVADYNRDGSLDIYTFIPNRVTKKLDLKIVDGDNFFALLADVQTGFSSPGAYGDIQFAVADYNGGGIPDIWRISPRAGENGQPEVTVINGADFVTTLASAELPLPASHTDMNLLGFVVADFNRDSVPDVWRVDRKTGWMTVISGANWATVLYDGASGVALTNNLDWQILGSDRARELIPPQMPILLSPLDGALTADATVRFKPGGLAKKHTVIFYDSAGIKLKTVNQNANWSLWCAATCAVDPAAYGVLVKDGSKFQWEVRSVNGSGKLLSPRWTYQVDRPGRVMMVNPAPDALSDLNPTFTWQTVPTATKYVLIVKRVGSTPFAKIQVLAASCAGGMCSMTLPAPLTTGAYLWRVKSVAGAGEVSQTPFVGFNAAATARLSPEGMRGQ